MRCLARRGPLRRMSRPNKVDLMVGSLHKNEHLKTVPVPSGEAGERVRSRMPWPITCRSMGWVSFARCWGACCSRRWDAWADLCGADSGGTGALRVGAEFLAQEVTKTICMCRTRHGRIISRSLSLGGSSE